MLDLFAYGEISMMKQKSNVLREALMVGKELEKVIDYILNEEFNNLRSLLLAKNRYEILN